MARTLGWCMTLNNYTEEQRVALLATECTYVIMGEEVGEQGTPHLQGFLRFKTEKSLKQMKLSLIHI